MMKWMVFRVRDVVVLVSLLLVLQSLRVSPLVSEPRSSAGALGADPINVFLDLSRTKVPVCENFTVNVTCSNVQDLYSWKLNMSFNSTSMKCLDFEEGPFLNQSGNTQFVPPVINNTAGAITGANCSLVGAPSGVNGTGTLVNATFQCQDVVGQSTLYVNNIELYNSTSAKIYNGTCSSVVSQIPTVTFRLLAVEKTFVCNSTQFPMRSAEYLIQSLTSFKNWQNGTWGDYNYRACIHLLSSVSTTELSQRQMLQYYRGVANKTSVLNEITTFLNDTGPGESNDLTVRIFYYCGHTGRGGYPICKNVTDEQGNPTNAVNQSYVSDRFLDLQANGNEGTGINDTRGPPPAPWWPIWPGDYNELGQALSSGDLGSSNCTLVILDTCYSGEYTEGLKCPGRVILTGTNENEEAQGWVNTTTDSSPAVGNWSWFTGNNNANYDNGTAFGPLGIVGGLSHATDKNSDRWRTAGEVFDFANDTTVAYSESLANGWNETTYNDSNWPNGTVKKAHPMHPTHGFFGVVSGDIPLVMYDTNLNGQPTSFFYNGAPQYPFNATITGPLWNMFGNGPDHERFSTSGGTTVPSPVWGCSTLPAASSAAVVDGMVFVGALGGLGVSNSVYALSLATGQVIWNFSAGGTIYSSPAVVDGFVFIGTLGGGGGGGGGGWLYALDEYTGRVRWQFQVPSGLGIFSSPTVTDGRVFIATMQQGSTNLCAVYALNETSGASIWTFPITSGDSIESSPTCANGRVFVGTMNGYVYALNASTTNPGGQQLWDCFLSGYKINSTAAADNGSIYVGTTYIGGGGGGRVYAFSQSAGGPPEWQFPSTGSAFPSGFSSSPGVDVGRNLVLIGCDLGGVCALSATSGSLIWGPTMFIGPINMSSVAISGDGLAYIGSIDGKLYCLNESTGATIWNCTTGGPIIASPALTDQHVIISSTGTNGKVVCVGPPFPAHDTTVSDVTTSSNTVTAGMPVNITCTVANNGNVNETFQVEYLCNDTAVWAAPTYVHPFPLHAENVTLSPGTNATITFTWDTTGFAPGTYTIIVMADSVPGETNTNNNTVPDGTVVVLQITVGGGGNRVPYCN